MNANRQAVSRNLPDVVDVENYINVHHIRPGHHISIFQEFNQPIENNNKFDETITVDDTYTDVPWFKRAYQANRCLIKSLSYVVLAALAVMLMSILLYVNFGKIEHEGYFSAFIVFVAIVLAASLSALLCLYIP